MAANLRVRAGTPLLLRKRVVYDSHRKAIEFALVTYRCDRFAPTLTLE
jgi:DNA-binding GntR family transcriptional regulator